MVAIMAASNNRNHEYFEDLLGAYALDALNDEERAELDEHLAGCDPCRAELAELSATVADLAFLTEEIEPPAGLRGRIRQNALNAPKSTSAEPTSIDDYRSRLLPWGMAAVFLIAALGLLAWNLQLRQDSPEQAVEMIVLRPAGEPTGDAGVAYYIPEEQVLVVVPRVLPELGPGEVYQVWLIDDGGPIPAGVLTGAGQRVAIAADRAAYQAVAVTIEPGPLGSPLPTTEPFIVTPLESS
jgi:anti-sigma-K factor RskA